VALTKANLVEQLHIKLEYSQKESLAMVESVLSILKQTLESGENVNISGFGKFEVKQKNARRGRNPQTGEAMILDPRRIISFKPSSLLKHSINK